MKKTTKKEIMQELNALADEHRSDESIECDLATAKELEADGYIYIFKYEDGKLTAEIEYDKVCETLFEDEFDLELFNEVRDGRVDDLDAIGTLVEWCDDGYLCNLRYVSHEGAWYCEPDWVGIIDRFCEKNL